MISGLDTTLNCALYGFASRLVSLIWSRVTSPLSCSSLICRLFDGTALYSDTLDWGYRSMATLTGLRPLPHIDQSVLMWGQLFHCHLEPAPIETDTPTRGRRACCPQSALTGPRGALLAARGGVHLLTTLSVNMTAPLFALLSQCAPVHPESQHNTVPSHWPIWSVPQKLIDKAGRISQAYNR